MADDTAELPPPWWEADAEALTRETTEIAAVNDTFSLDEQVLREDRAVVFKGELRQGAETCAAEIHYPPGYLDGAPVVVYALTMPITSEHKDEALGLLCLDHAEVGNSAAISGAEAIERAEELWRLAADDPDELERQSAPVPAAHIQSYLYEDDSRILVMGARAEGIGSGWVRVSLQSRQPIRGAVDGLGELADLADLGKADKQRALEIHRASLALRGPTSVAGVWKRLSKPPPSGGAYAVSRWLEDAEPELLEKARWFATIAQQAEARAFPALAAVVFSDAGPGRGEVHDEWIFLVLWPNGSVTMPRTFRIEKDDQWVRQPHLQRLETKTVGLVGVGALGSEAGLMLARAGVGAFFTVDSDYVAPGNMVRHAATLNEVGLGKSGWFGAQLGQINPWAGWRGSSHSLGLVSSPGALSASRDNDDVVAKELARCDLIIDASANDATGFLLGRIADLNRVPLVSVAVGPGAWGARVLLQRRGRSGCLKCLFLHQEKPVAGGPELPDLPADPEATNVGERGCGATTFTGPGFELVSAAAAAARSAVQVLLDGDGYPAAEFDLATLTFRSEAEAESRASYDRLPRHPECDVCSG